MAWWRTQTLHMIVWTNHWHSGARRWVFPASLSGHLISRETRARKSVQTGHLKRRVIAEPQFGVCCHFSNWMQVMAPASLACSTVFKKNSIIPYEGSHIWLWHIIVLANGMKWACPYFEGWSQMISDTEIKRTFLFPGSDYAKITSVKYIHLEISMMDA